MRYIKIIKSLDYSAFLLALCLLAGLKPYFLWGMPGAIDIGIKLIVITLSLFFINMKDNRSLLFFVLFFLLLFFQGLIRNISIIDWLVTIIPVTLLPFISFDKGRKCFSYFVVLLAILFSLSLLIWIGVLIGLPLPYEVIEPVNALKDYNYFAYPLVLVPLKEDIMQSFRFSGPFDEPGVVGTICLICLFIGKYNLRKWYNVILLIVGICSFSLAFFIGSLLYLSINVLGRKKWPVLLMGLFILGFYFATNDNEFFEELIYSRMEWDSSTGSLSGDNRSLNGEGQYLDQIRGTSTYWFGGGNEANKRFEGSWGYKNVIIIYGFLFVFLYCLFFFALAFYRKLSIKNIVLFGVIFISVIYQRPDLFETTKVFLFSYYILLLSKEKETNRVSLKKLAY